MFNKNIKKGVTILGIAGTWDGFVATPQDLYYNGVNNAGLTFGTLTGSVGSTHPSFEGTYIELGTYQIVRIKSPKAYNFAGYNNLEITIYYKDTVSSGIAGYISLQKFNDESVIPPNAENHVKANDAVSSGVTKVYNISLANIQTTLAANFFLGFQGRNKYSQVKRIRLVK